MKYRIYIDEVGNPDLASSDNPNHRFLSLTGVILELGHVEDVVFPQMENIKKTFLGSHPDDPIIFHRKEMLNAVYPFEKLKNVIFRKLFDAQLLSLLQKWEYTIITVCLDKKTHKETYTTWRYEPYHYCLAVLLERFFFFLERINAHGDVIAESRGGKEDRRLKDSFARLWEKGTDFVAPEQFQKVFTSKQLKVKPKANNISGLQLTDLLAHPSRNEILKEQGFMNREFGTFSAKVIEILQKKYDQVDGKIYGKKFL
jgi:hypothetical protein